MRKKAAETKDSTLHVLMRRVLERGMKERQCAIASAGNCTTVARLIILTACLAEAGPASAGGGCPSAFCTERVGNSQLAFCMLVGFTTQSMHRVAAYSPRAATRFAGD